jgi:cytochrome c oxidase subunit 2
MSFALVFGMVTPALATPRWPLNYLVTQGPRANPAAVLTWGLIGLSVLVVLIIAIAVVLAILIRRDRSPPADLQTAQVTGSGGGMIWIYAGLPLTVIALFIALIWTMQVLAQVDAPPWTPRITLDVTGHQWWWEVRYVGNAPTQAFTTANEIHVPVGEPILVRLFGGDVIHSFWAPALTGKTDTIPGRTNLTWFQADRPGVYLGQCTEYCGIQHAHMAFTIVAQSPTAFEAWRQAQVRPAAPPQTPDEIAGEREFVAVCGKCHAIDGTPAQGQKAPNLTHLMSRSSLAAGVLDNTVDNLSGWISNPQALKPGAKMPATYLSGPELHDVVAYLETLK